MNTIADWATRNKIWLLIGGAIMGGYMGLQERQRDRAEMQSLRTEAQHLKSRVDQLAASLDEITSERAERFRRMARKRTASLDEITSELSDLKQQQEAMISNLKQQQEAMISNLKQQREAMLETIKQQRVGVSLKGSRFSEPIVQPTSTKYIGDLISGKFHKPDCYKVESQKRSIFLADMLKGEAQRRGFSPCLDCKP